MSELVLLQKQKQLRAKSQLLRESLSQQVERWRPTMTMADHCLSALSWLYQRPVITVLVLGLLAEKKPDWLYTVLRSVFKGLLNLQKLNR